MFGLAGGVWPCNRQLSARPDNTAEMAELRRIIREAAAAQAQAEQARAAEAAAHAQRMQQLEQQLRQVSGTNLAQQQMAAIQRDQQAAQQAFAQREAVHAAAHAAAVQQQLWQLNRHDELVRAHEQQLAVCHAQLGKAQAAVLAMDALLAALQRPPSRGWPVTPDEKAAALAAMPFLQETKFHIAISGESGRGKSTLINAVLRKVGKEGSAETGALGEVTHVAASYDLSGNVSVVDLPGCGTMTYPAAEYVRTFHLRLFDAVVLVTAGRLSENDVNLCRCLQESGIPVVVVRNKMDQDLVSVLEKLRQKLCLPSLEAIPVDKVHATCEELREKVLVSYAQLEGVDPADVFLVSAEAMDPQKTQRMGYPVQGVVLDESRFLAEIMQKTLARRTATAPA